MNRRLVVIAAVLIFLLIIILIATVFLFNAMTRESSVIEPAGPVKTETAEPPPGYSISEKPVPDIDEVDRSIKTAAEKRKAVNKAIDKIEEKRNAHEEAEIAEQEEPVTGVIQPSADEKEGTTISLLPEKKEVTFPSSEQVKKMRSRGIIAY